MTSTEQSSPKGALGMQTSSTQTQANPITTAIGGALIGSKFGGFEAGIGAGLGFLGGLL